MFNFFNKVTDPVCGMKIDKKDAKFSSGAHFFCSQNCKEKFEADPKKFLEQKEKSSGGCCH